MNETIKKFGYPDTLLKEYQYWVVMLRPQQITIGSMVLACKEPVGSLAEVPSDAFAELPLVTGDLEAALKQAFNMEKINYLLLMMVDKDVHFHVIPRYSENKTFEGQTATDPGWKKLPDMTNVIDFNDEQFASLKKYVVDCW